jgi:hypothetical protein
MLLPVLSAPVGRWASPPARVPARGLGPAQLGELQEHCTPCRRGRQFCIIFRERTIRCDPDDPQLCETVKVPIFRGVVRCFSD